MAIWHEKMLVNLLFREKEKNIIELFGMLVLLILLECGEDIVGVLMQDIYGQTWRNFCLPSEMRRSKMKKRSTMPQQIDCYYCTVKDCRKSIIMFV